MAKRARDKMQIEKLSEFMLNEMKKREISGREFAKLVGVSHGTINRLLNFDSSKDSAVYPSLEVLLKIAVATGVDVCALLALIAPESTRAVTNPEAVILSQEIEKLPDTLRSTIDDIIIGHAKKTHKTNKG